MKLMKAVVFTRPGHLEVEELPRPSAGPGEAVVRVTLTSMDGTDVHIVRGEYPVRAGLVLGHELVGVIEALGDGLGDLYALGERVIVGAITPCGQCYACLNGAHAQCGGVSGGWRLGRTINGTWAEYVTVPNARANLAPIPTGLLDEDVLLCTDVFSAGLAGAEGGGVRAGDAVAVFGEGPIGLAASLGARLRGAALIVGVDVVGQRLELARRFGVTATLNVRDGDPVPEIRRLTGGLGVDVAIEALGRQETFEHALAALRPGGTLSSLGVYSGKVQAPATVLHAGLADQKIVTSLCPGGKERMRRLMAMVEHRRVDLTPLITHHFSLDDIDEAFELFSRQRDGVLKIALHPSHVFDRFNRVAVGALDAEC
jgi:alcohol dehydrogenase